MNDLKILPSEGSLNQREFQNDYAEYSDFAMCAFIELIGQLGLLPISLQTKFDFRSFGSAVIHHRFGFPSTSRTAWLYLR